MSKQKWLRKQDQIIATITLLAETFPQTFFVYELKRRPLKVGIRDDILAKVEGAIQPNELSDALRSYCGNINYARALVQGGVRIDLDGNAASIITADEIEHARRALVGMLKKREARKRAPTKLQTCNLKPAPAATPEKPKRISLADLRAAAARRKTGAPA